MKFFAALIWTVMWVAIVSGKQKCVVERGRIMTTFAKNKINLEVPCKYNMINSRCGEYRVVVTPGNRYLYPTYIIDTVWLSVNGTNDEVLWKGRSTNKKVAMYIIYGESRQPFEQKGGSMTTNQLFNVYHDNFSVIVEPLNKDFRLTFAPFDFNGNRHHDSRLEFVCNADMEQVTFPTQYCGTTQEKVFLTYVEETFGTKKKKEEIVLYDIFQKSAGIAQTDKDCKLATTALSAAVNETMRKKAIIECRMILDTEIPRECAMKYACNPMAVFRACAQFVVSDYTDSAACKELGAAIDLCNGYDDLASRIQALGCYTDLLTAADNPYYNQERPY